jgi:hypothetical protein
MIMMRAWVGLGLLLPAWVAACTGWAAAPAASTQEAVQEAVAPAAAAASASPEVRQWLERIEQRAREVRDLQARVRYESVDELLGSRQIRAGVLVYDAGPPARFAARFDRAVIDEQLRMQSRSYIFDGRWLAERHDDEKLFWRRELVPAGQEGRDLLRLGEGPFAVPLGLEADAVLERFEVELIEPAGDEPVNSVHLRLTPREHVHIDQEQIDLWYDRDTLLPIRAVTREQDTQSILILSDVRINTGLEGQPFDTTPPAEPGWQIQIVPLEASTAPASPGQR